jgi:hypothetical protein
MSRDILLRRARKEICCADDEIRDELRYRILLSRHRLSFFVFIDILQQRVIVDITTILLRYCYRDSDMSFFSLFSLPLRSYAARRCRRRHGRDNISQRRFSRDGSLFTI